jgi:hypothetical protein
MNNIDTVRMAKALLEASGFVVTPRGDYDKDQRAFIELDDELKHCKRANGELLTKLSALEAEIETLKFKASRSEGKRHSPGHWEEVDPYMEIIADLPVGRTHAWDRDTPEDSKKYTAAIGGYVSREKREGGKLGGRNYVVRDLGNMVTVTRKC